MILEVVMSIIEVVAFIIMVVALILYHMETIKENKKVEQEVEEDNVVCLLDFREEA